MQTDHQAHVDRTSHHIDRDVIEPEPGISVSHFVHVLRSYRHVILFSVLAVAFGYAIIATAVFLFAPAERTTMQSFRLDFEGAGEGRYPNATKFNVADIINGPILTRVYNQNRLSNYLPPGDFSRSIFVLESNREYDQLAAEYQAKLADPKLTPVDRERLQREFELKRQAITKNEYTVYFTRKLRTRTIPEPIARKVLLDVLNGWADFAVNQQHVIAYEVSVLSPEILTPSPIEQNHIVTAIAVLRSKANRVIFNLINIEKLPGATLARTPQDRLSLEEVRIRLDEMIRFRLEPLLAAILHDPAVVGDRSSTLRFLESQLAYDQRQLEAAQRYADSAREAIAVYEQPARRETTSEPKPAGEPPSSGDAVMTQLNDTFLDRLMELTGRAGDAEFRQGLLADYRAAVAETIPLKQAVAYDEQVLAGLRKPPTAGAAPNAESVRAQIAEARAEIAQLINKMNELFQIVSRNMTPSTQLFSLNGPPLTRTLRAIDVRRLAIYGILVILISFPVIVASCLLHNRVREEEAAEEYGRHQPITAP